jgi:hypothetical protein
LAVAVVARGRLPFPHHIVRDTTGAGMFNRSMAADIITPLIKAGVELLTHALAHARRKMGKRKYERLLSATIAELLKEHPDIDEARARVAALESARAAPSPDLLRLKALLKSVEAHLRRERKASKRRKPRKAVAAKPRRTD